MSNALKLIVYPVKDVEAAKKLFTTFLGTEPYVDSPYYVGYKVGEMEIGLNPNAFAQNITTPIAYTDVMDINASLQSLISAGAQSLQSPTDVGKGLLVASVKDANGNVLGLRQQPKTS